ncbi:hypothetical protein [Chlorobium phaeobacteroides]|uniref:Uncharacterized protein n=1 Tax=Chlorobium phaeobacteroides (strain DSM 266 / SMG 266 / 2430) TaxID=290317 RepID=A1BFS8_CHLPD|nr:hypothetical protein [Chlorobium phaeobacteroides]ABL65255.1 hypothetical protein Cpha266_1221 [Chlorobium phaeobacteroides DSM 266]
MLEKEGPFGLYMGMNISDVDGEMIEDTGAGACFYSSLSKGHSAFNDYMLLFSKSRGLYRIFANGRSINSDFSGVGFRACFDKMMTSLTVIYGDCFFLDSFKGEYPGNWMELMCDHELHYTVAWEKRFDSCLKHSIRKIMLVSDIESYNSGKYSLIYSFENDNEADSEMQNTDNDIL